MSNRNNKKFNSKEVDVEVMSKGKGSTNKRGRKPEIRKGGDNDVSWYSRSQQLILDAAQLSYASILGARIESDTTGWQDTSFGSALPSVPGVMSLHWRPALGVSADAYSSLNVAAKRLYSFVRHANSGHSNYDSPDLMLYVLAMDSLYTLHAMGVRAYGLARYYTMRNRYVPDELLIACGFDPALQYNLADFRMFLNTISLKLSSLAVPMEFDLFKRHVWMTSGVYADSPQEKAQLYVFKPDQLWKFEATKYETGGSLAPVSLTGTGINSSLTISEYQTKVNTLLDPIIADEDMNIMSGDILKAYGNEGVIRVGSVGEDFFVIPEFNMEVLSQIQNTIIVNPVVGGSFTDKEKGEVYQENNILYFNPLIYAETADGMQGYVMLTMSMDNPQPEHTMVATRNTVMLGQSDPLTGAAPLSSVGSEYIVKAVIHSRRMEYDVDKWIYKSATFPITSSQFTIEFPSNTGSTISANTVNAVNQRILLLTQLTKFAMHPTLRIVTPSFAATMPARVITFRDFFGDLDTYTQITAATLKKMHDTAVLSMLHVEGAFRR